MIIIKIKMQWFEDLFIITAANPRNVICLVVAAYPPPFGA